MIKLELCTDNLEGVLAAGKFQLNRVELCSALELGGLTPNLGLVKACVAANCVDIHAMLRPRGGGFVYTSEEVKIIKSDLKTFAEAGVSGVVFGILNEDTTISKANKMLCDLAKSYGLESTFHRAFDFVQNKNDAVRQLIDFDFTRILTSGGASKAIKGLEIIKELQMTFGKQIQIVAGSGVNADNALIFKKAGIQQLHFTARRTVIKRKDNFGFGAEFNVDEAKIETIIKSVQ